MGRLNPEKFSQRLQDLNRNLDFIPIEKTSDSLKVTKAYGKSLPEDELRFIMGRAIPPEWTVNLLSLGKEPWKFRDLEDQLNIYRQQCVKLLPLPQPPLRVRTDARTNPSAQRATQPMSVLAHVYAVSRQNQITTTVPYLE
jgi:hypothetical protein